MKKDCKNCEENPKVCEEGTCACHNFGITKEPKEEKCNCKEMSCNVPCEENHTHKTFACKICTPEKPKEEKIGRAHV